MTTKNIPNELSNCIRDVSVIRDSLSSRPEDFNIKIAAALSERFESDAKDFYEDFTHHMGDVPYYPE